MRKTLPISMGILTLFLLGLFSLNHNNNIDNLKKRQAYFLKNRPINKNLSLTKRERLSKGLPPNKYFEREYLLEMNPALGRPTPEKLFELQKQLIANRKKQAKAQRAPGDASDNAWVERGPNNIGGRTRAILFDPNDTTHKRVFAGGVSGGLWVNSDITNANSAWTRISGISENVSVTAFTVDPNNANNIFIATGETYTSGDVTGNGIWRSTDGGTNWAHVFGGSTGTTDTSGSQDLIPGQYNINDIKAWNNSGATVIFAAVGANYLSFSGKKAAFIDVNEYGLYKSSDNGTSWTKVSITNVSSTSHSYEINDIEIAADNGIWAATGNTVYGDGGGMIFKSTNGINFAKKDSIYSGTTYGKRTQIAVSSTNANTIYVLGETGLSNPVTLLKTTNGFATTPTTLALPNDADTGIPANDFTRGQAFYDLMLEVDPNNDAIVYVGGIDSFRSADSGASWVQMTKWSNNNALLGLNIPTVHADSHALAFNPGDSDIAVLGNDGGVYYASSLVGALTSTTAISSRNNNFNVTQFYKGAIGQSISSEMFLGGAQDNGSLFKSSATAGINSFTDIYGGDGAYEFIDKNGTYLITSYVYNTYSLFPLPLTFDSFGNPQGEKVIQNDQNTGAFINPAVLDNNLNILYTDGTNSTTNRIARYKNITSSPSRANIKNNAKLTGEPTAFAVAPTPTTSTTLYVGTDDGKLLKITNANAGSRVWTDITGDSFVGSVSAIAFGASASDIIVTFHNYGVISVWFTTDGGTTWANKEGNLPDLPVKAVMMNPTNNDEVILGTDLGVWRTDNFSASSPTWSQSQNGMQNSKVTSFDLRTADNTVLASTYGRGLFTGKFITGATTTWTGNIDSNWNTAGNWTNGIPTSSSTVSIPNGLNTVINTTTSATANNITIDPSASLTITGGGNLTVSGNLTNNGTFTINSDATKSGSLIVNGSSTGNVTYNRHMTGGTNNNIDWHLIVAPVGNQSISSFVNNSANKITTSGVFYSLTPYDNTVAAGSGNWTHWTTDGSGLGNVSNAGNFIAGKGYEVHTNASGPVAITGSVATSQVSIDITKPAASGNAWNLIGNPFPSSITKADFINGNSAAMDASFVALYLWDPTLATPAYVEVNLATGATYIAPGQAFFVKSVAGGATINFTTAMRTNQPTAVFQKAAVSNTPTITLKADNGSIIKTTDIKYIAGATLGLDPGYDAGLIDATSSNFKLYTHLVEDNGVDFMLQVLPDNVYDTAVIPVGLDAVSGTQVTFKADITNLPLGKKVYLEDRLLGVYNELNNIDKFYTITFSADISGIGRFYLHTLDNLSTLAVDDFTKLNYTVIAQPNNNSIRVIGNIESSGKLNIYDTLGRLIKSLNLNVATDQSINVPNLAAGIYMVKISSKNSQFSAKIAWY